MKWSALWALLFAGLVLVAEVHSQADADIEDEEDEPVASDDAPPLQPMEKPVYKAPVVKGNSYFSDAFESVEGLSKKWIQSKASKDDTEDSIAKYDGEWKVEEAADNPLDGDLGLVLKSRAKHHAIAAKLTKPYKFAGKPFIVQYEVKFQNGQECGGAYVKLLSHDAKLNLAQLKDKTPYTIMFGPDKCGNDNKLHFIFRHKNPKTGEFEEKHAKKPTADISTFFTDKKTHLYTLVIHPDNVFEIFVDQNVVNSGNLLEDVEPAVNPAKEIDDPNDKKPADWDERPKIPDPDAKKPDDWDESEPEMIPDEAAVMPDGWLVDEPELVPEPDASKPSDWDDDMDGEYEAPLINNPKCENAPGCGEWKRPNIKNPKYMGKWTAPMVDNPEYKGKWKPQRIANPDFFEDLTPYKMTSIGAVGLELWSMSNDILFDNFLITDDKSVADMYATDSWQIKRSQELMSGPSGKSVVDAVMDMTADRPWLWAVFIVVVILPIILVIAYCCMSGNKADDIAKAKKTDEVSPDDQPDETEPQEEAEEDVGGGGDTPKDSKKKSSKSALDAEEEETEAAAAEPKEESATTPKKTSPRKRKPRKD